MSAKHDTALAAYLRANKIVASDRIASAQTHQSTVMPTSSLPQVLLHLRYITQEVLDRAVRAVSAGLDQAEGKEPSGVQERLSRAVGDAHSTSQELAAVAKLIDEALKRP